MQLNEIISNALDELGYGENEFAKCYRMALRGIRKMKWDFIGKIVTTPITVLPNLTAPLPEGLLKIRSVDVINEDNGEKQSLTENNNISLLDTTCGTRNVAGGRGDDYWLEEDDDVLDSMIYETLKDGSHYNRGEYRHDADANILVFPPSFPHKKIVVEHTSSTDAHGFCDVPEMVSEALLAWIVWRCTLSMKGASIGDKREKERMYFTELKNAKLRISNPTKALKNQTSRRAVRQTIKA